RTPGPAAPRAPVNPPRERDLLPGPDLVVPCGDGRGLVSIHLDPIRGGRTLRLAGPRLWMAHRHAVRLADDGPRRRRSDQSIPSEPGPFAGALGRPSEPRPRAGPAAPAALHARPRAVRAGSRT